MIGFVTLLPDYRPVAGDCRGGEGCACSAHRLLEGLRGEGMPKAEVDAFWERLAALRPPAWSLFPQAWA